MKPDSPTLSSRYYHAPLAMMLLALVGCGGAPEEGETRPQSEEAQLESRRDSLSTSALTEGFVRIMVRHSWQCLDLRNSSYDPSTNFSQYPYHGGDNQQFLIEDMGNGFVRIRVKHSWQCLDLDGASYNPSTHFSQYPCHGGDNQQFRIEDLGNGFQRIRVKHSGQCLDLDAGSYNPSTNFSQYPCHGGKNQQFLIEKL